MSEPDELLAILCTTPCKDCRDKAAAIRARWRLVPVEPCEHAHIEADRKPDGSADIRCLVCGFSGRIMSYADYAAQIAALRPY